MDHDQKRMSVLGPMKEETRIMVDIEKAKAKGRDVTCTIIAKSSLLNSENEARRLKSTYELVPNVF